MQIHLQFRNSVVYFLFVDLTPFLEEMTVIVCFWVVLVDGA